MPRKLPEACSHIVEAINDVAAFTAGIPMHRWLGDKQRRLAIERCLQIIAEAARSIPQHIQKDYPDIPWASIKGMGDILRHHYEHLKAEIIVNTLRDDLPALKAAVLEISPIYVRAAETHQVTAKTVDRSKRKPRKKKT